MTLTDKARSCKAIVRSDQQNQRHLTGNFVNWASFWHIPTQLHRNWSILQDLKTSGLLMLTPFTFPHFLVVPPVGAKIAKWLVANKVAKASLAGWASPRVLLWSVLISSWKSFHVIHCFSFSLLSSNQRSRQLSWKEWPQWSLKLTATGNLSRPLDTRPMLWKVLLAFAPCSKIQTCPNKWL